MGITCCSKTARGVIKVAGEECDMLAKRIILFQETNKENFDLKAEQLMVLIKKLSKDPYLYIGQNRVPHKLIVNGTLEK